MAPKKAHHRGTYHRRAAQVRAAAYANPETVCWRCGRPLQPNVKGLDRWTAGHLRDSDPTSPLLAEHARCNYSAGASMGNRARNTLPPSRAW